MYKVKNLVHIVIVIVILTTMFSGCTGNSNRLTAIETVQKYFDYWNDKDLKAMRSLVYENKTDGDHQLELLNSVTLDSCMERENIDKSDWYEAWYPNPYDFTCIDTEFTIDAKEGFILPNGTHAYGYWLVRESENSDWIIVAFGQG